MGGTPRRPTPQDHPSLMRSLGEFFGHVWAGVKSDPAADAAKRRIARTSTQEKIEDTPAGKVVVRRTVIEEVRLVEPPRTPPPRTPPPN